MTHCTVCGAAAREGAKFCTSCGARLVDTVTAPAAEPDEATVAEPITIESPESPPEPDDDQVAVESTWAPVENGDVTGADGSAPAEESDAPEPEMPVTETVETPEYTASWPTGENDAADSVADVPASDATGSETSAWASWSSASDDTVTREVPDSFATDATQDPRSEEARAEEPAVADAGAVETPAPDPDPMAASHHGASEWESWEPVASGEATVPAARGEIGTSVRRMLDDLANRIDRLIDPESVDTRGVDADELADQLDRWSRAHTDADGLLEVVRAVRTSPRDVDALTRLADRAPDLELLVRHYQAITDGAGDWAGKLRSQQTQGGDDA